MFGKDNIQEIIRRYHRSEAQKILSTCFEEVNRFLDGRAPEDDMTMIVIKTMDD